MHDIFLSYSRKDTDTMHRVKQTLMDAGLSVWTDEGIIPGTPSWKRAIEQAIIDCASLICIMSPDAKESEWVRKELDFAELHDKHIFLILARGDKRNSIPFGYATHQWTDIRNDSNFDSLMARLVQTIQGQIGKPISKIEPEPVPEKIPVQQTQPDTTQLPESLEIIKKRLPDPFDWCHIPAGNVTLQEGGYVPAGGQTFTVDAFYMAKFPVTNRQFAEFIGAEGYRTQSFWTEQGWKICQTMRWTQPRYYHNTEWNRPLYPVVGVCWYEAIAFCNWLTSLLNTDDENPQWIITLPSEQQWQRAGQGDDGRIYPAGNQFDPESVNMKETNQRYNSHTIQVESLPSNLSPYGVRHMSGNVREWTATAWEGGEHISTTSKEQFVLRGGFFDSDREGIRIDARNFYHPSERLNHYGFRICAVPANSNP